MFRIVLVATTVLSFPAYAALPPLVTDADLFGVSITLSVAGKSYDWIADKSVTIQQIPSGSGFPDNGSGHFSDWLVLRHDRCISSTGAVNCTLSSGYEGGMFLGKMDWTTRNIRVALTSDFPNMPHASVPENCNHNNGSGCTVVNGLAGVTADMHGIAFPPWPGSKSSPTIKSMLDPSVTIYNGDIVFASQCLDTGGSWIDGTSPYHGQGHPPGVCVGILTSSGVANSTVSVPLIAAHFLNDPTWNYNNWSVSAAVPKLHVAGGKLLVTYDQNFIDGTYPSNVANTISNRQMDLCKGPDRRYWGCVAGNTFSPSVSDPNQKPRAMNYALINPDPNDPTLNTIVDLKGVFSNGSMAIFWGGVGGDQAGVTRADHCYRPPLQGVASSDGCGRLMFFLQTSPLTYAAGRLGSIPGSDRGNYDIQINGNSYTAPLVDPQGGTWIVSQVDNYDPQSHKYPSNPALPDYNNRLSPNGATGSGVVMWRQDFSALQFN